MSKFLTYWSLAFAVFYIWIVSIAVALADVKDELLDKVYKQWVARGKAQLRPTNPLAGLSVAETLTPPARTAAQDWVYGEVSRIAGSLGLPVTIIVLQDSMDHFLVHFTQGPRLVTYRLDKTWVAEARAGKTEQLERIRRAVEQHLRVEFLGEKRPAPAPAAPATAKPAAAPSPAAGTAVPSPAPASAASAAASPAVAGSPAAAPGAELSREERIAAAKAKAEALKAQREGAKSPDGSAPPDGQAGGTGSTPAGD